MSEYAYIPGGSDCKESACNAGDLDLIPGLGRSPGKENDNPVHYPCLENSLERGARRAIVHGVTKSQTRLRDEHSDFSSSLSALLRSRMFLPCTLLQTPNFWNFNSTFTATFLIYYFKILHLESLF